MASQTARERHGTVTELRLALPDSGQAANRIAQAAARQTERRRSARRGVWRQLVGEQDACNGA